MIIITAKRYWPKNKEFTPYTSIHLAYGNLTDTVCQIQSEKSALSSANNLPKGLSTEVMPQFIDAANQHFTLSWSHYLVLMRIKDDALVELTLLEDANVYAAAYQLYLPDKRLLKLKMKEWIEEYGNTDTDRKTYI